MELLRSEGILPHVSYDEKPGAGAAWVQHAGHVLNRGANVRNAGLSAVPPPLNWGRSDRKCACLARPGRLSQAVRLQPRPSNPSRGAARSERSRARRTPARTNRWSGTLRRAMLAGMPAPMLARLETSLPRGAGWIYEPKFDGFRGLLWRSWNGTVRLLSRNLKDLSRPFPELIVAGDALPMNTLIDGEIVIADAQGNGDFSALQRRLSAGQRDARTAALEGPSVLLAFDALWDAGIDLTDCPLSERRAHLESVVEPASSSLQLVMQTHAVEEAEDWLRLLPSIEGVVAKRSDGRYRAGERGWIKVKRQRTVDCVVIGVAGDPALPSLVLGLRHADGRLHHFGLARASRDLVNTVALAELIAGAGAEERPIGSRWQHAAVPAWRRVLPLLVCEVAFTTLDGARWLRQPARFLRWRPDRYPDDCWLEQVARA